MTIVSLFVIHNSYYIIACVLTLNYSEIQGLSSIEVWLCFPKQYFLKSFLKELGRVRGFVTVVADLLCDIRVFSRHKHYQDSMSHVRSFLYKQNKTRLYNSSSTNL